MDREEAQQMAPFIEKALKSKKKELQELRQEIFEKNQRFEVLRQEVEHFEGVWKSIELAFGLENSENSEIKKSSLLDTASSQSPRLNKTQAILEIIRKNGDKGVTPKEVYEILEKDGVPIPDNYVHTILSKQLRSGNLSKSGKRYFWVEPSQK